MAQQENLSGSFCCNNQPNGRPNSKRISLCRKLSKRIEPETVHLPNGTLDESWISVNGENKLITCKSTETKILDLLGEKHTGLKNGSFVKVQQAFDIQEQTSYKGLPRKYRQQVFDEKDRNKRSRLTLISSNPETRSKFDPKKTKIFARFVSEHSVQKMNDVAPRTHSPSEKSPRPFRDETLPPQFNQQVAGRLRAKMSCAKRSKEMCFDSPKIFENGANALDDQNEAEKEEASSMSATVDTDLINSRSAAGQKMKRNAATLKEIDQGDKNSTKNAAADISQTFSGQQQFNQNGFEQDNLRRACTKLGPTNGDLASSEGSLLRSLLLEGKRRSPNDPVFSEVIQDFDPGLDNIIVNVLDLRDDDLYKLLCQSENKIAGGHCNDFIDNDDNLGVDVDNVVCELEVSRSPSNDSGVAAGGGSFRSLDENEAVSHFVQMDRTTQTEATESRKNSPHRKTGKDETGTEFFFGGNESFCFGRDKRNFEERRKKKIAKVSGRSGSVQDEDAVAGQTHSLQDPDWLFCPIPGCGFWTKKPDRMSRHKICHVDEVKQSYRCPDCGVKFFSLTKMLKHDRKKHTGVKDYECRLCLAEVTDIHVHMRIHREDKEFDCRHCTAKFRHRSSLIRHLFLHTGHRPYKCQTCGSFFTGRDRLRDHILRQHPELLTDPDVDLQQHLDQSKNSEKHFEEKYRTKSEPKNPEKASESGSIQVQVPVQQQIYLQIGGLQFQALQVVPLSGVRLAATTIHLQPIPVIPGPQHSQVFLEGSSKSDLAATLGAMTPPRMAENPLDVAMREIREGSTGEKFCFGPSLNSEVHDSWTRTDILTATCQVNATDQFIQLNTSDNPRDSCRRFLSSDMMTLPNCCIISAGSESQLTTSDLNSDDPRP